MQHWFLANLKGDPMAQLFGSLGYDVSWDGTGAADRWYEVSQDGKMFVQIDMGVPAATLAQDFGSWLNGEESTSGGPDYEVSGPPSEAHASDEQMVQIRKAIDDAEAVDIIVRASLRTDDPPNLGESDDGAANGTFDDAEEGPSANLLTLLGHWDALLDKAEGGEHIRTPDDQFDTYDIVVDMSLYTAHLRQPLDDPCPDCGKTGVWVDTATTERCETCGRPSGPLPPEPREGWSG